LRGSDRGMVYRKKAAYTGRFRNIIAWLTDTTFRQVTILFWLVFICLLSTKKVKAQCPSITNTTQTSVTVCSGSLVDSLQVRTTAFWPDKIELVRFDTPQVNPYKGGVSLGELISSNGIATMRTVAFPPNTDVSDKTYYVYGRLIPLASDTTCRPFALVTVIVKPAPIATLLAREATCQDSVSLADGWVRINNVAPTDTYEVANKGIFSGNSQPIPTDGVVIQHLKRTGKPETYAVRLYSAFGCFVERSITLLNTSCACLPAKCVPIFVRKIRSGRAGK